MRELLRLLAMTGSRRGVCAAANTTTKKSTAPSPNACVLAFVFLLFGTHCCCLPLGVNQTQVERQGIYLGVLSTGSHSGSDANCELFPRGTWMCFTITPILLSAAAPSFGQSAESSPDDLDASVEGFLPCPVPLGIRAPVQNGAFLDAHTQPFSRNAGRRLLKGFAVPSLLIFIMNFVFGALATSEATTRLLHGQLLYALE